MFFIFHSNVTMVFSGSFVNGTLEALNTKVRRHCVSEVMWVAFRAVL